jgi:hypothetical protein
MVIIFLLSFVCAVALATQAVHVQRIMRQVKAAQPGILNGVLQFLVLEFGNLAALCADLVMMRITVIAFFVLRGISELMLDNQPGIDKQYDGVVQRRTAHSEILLVCHQRIKRINIEMAVYGINSVEYGISFGSLAMPVHIEIFGEYLPNRIFHVLTFHLKAQFFNSQQS